MMQAHRHIGKSRRAVQSLEVWEPRWKAPKFPNAHALVCGSEGRSQERGAGPANKGGSSQMAQLRELSLSASVSALDCHHLFPIQAAAWSRCVGGLAVGAMRRPGDR